MPQLSRHQSRAPRTSNTRSSKTRKRNTAPGRKRRRLFAEVLEQRRLLAGDAYVFDIPDDPLLGDGDVNQTRISVVDGGVEVFDVNRSVVLDYVSLSEVASLQFNGGDDDNELLVDFLGGDFRVPLAFEGGGQSSASGDRMTLLNGAADSIAMDFVDPNSGTVELASVEVGLNQTISYSGLEPIWMNLAATSITFNFLGGDETIALSDDGAAGDGINRIDSTLGEVVMFASPLSSVTINGGTGADEIQIGELDSATAFTELVVNGDADDDTIELSHLLPTINATLNGGEGVDQFTVGALDLVTGSVAIDGGNQPNVGTYLESITAQSMDVTQSVEIGDSLLIDDASEADPQSYLVNASAVERLGTPAINFQGVEQFELRTGTGNDDVTVDSTTDAASLIRTGTGDDRLTVNTTADNSVLRAELGAGADQAAVATTGAASLVFIDTAADDDDVVLQSSGVGSGISVQTGTGADLLTISTTGETSKTAVDLGDDADIANLIGLGLNSFSEVFTGDGSDSVNVSSDASGNRINPVADPSGTLDGLLGSVALHAETNTGATTFTHSVSAGGVTRELELDEGDRLTISDQSVVGDQVYTLDVTEFSRLGGPSIGYTGFEHLAIETGSGNDQFNVLGTATLTESIVELGQGNDTATIATTGDASYLSVDAGAGMSTVDLIGSGDSSITRLETGDDDDEVDVLSTGSDSGLDVASHGGSDVITIRSLGEDTVNLIDTDSDLDVVNIRGTGSGSVSDIVTGDGSDTINLSSNADGALGSPTGTQIGDLDGILGQINVDAGTESAGPSITQGLTIKGVSASADVASGDVLNVSDQSNVASHSYLISADEVQRLATFVLHYEEVESLNVFSGSNDDQVTIDTTLDQSFTSLSTGNGNDVVQFNGTGAGSIVTVDVGAQDDEVILSSTGEQSVVLIDGNTGDDVVNVTSSGSGSAVDIQGGSDSDVVTIASTGDNSVTRLRLDDGDDIANVQRLAAGSATAIYGGSGNDTFNVYSTADGSIGNPSGNFDGDLNQLEGLLCLFGETDGPSPQLAAELTVGPVTVNAGGPRGDQINLSDRSTATDQQYSFEPNVFERVGGPAIEFETMESVQVETSQANDSLTIITVADNSYARFVTGEGDDTVAVQSTGTGSLVEIDTARGQDQVAINDTGEGSLLHLATGDGSDSVDVTTIGANAGLDLNAGMVDGSVDVLTVQNTGAASVFRAAMGDGNDVVNVRATASGSQSQFDGNAGDDTFNLYSNANGTDLNPNGSLTGNLDALLGGIDVVGADDNGSITVSEDVQARQTDGDVASVTQTVEVGDRLNLIDESSVNDSTYELEGDAFRRTDTPLGTVNFIGLEWIELQTGIGADHIEISATADASYTHVLTGVGDDQIAVLDSGTASILEIETDGGADSVIISSTGDASILSVETGTDEDSVAIQSVGDAAGINVSTGDQSDTVTLEPETVVSARVSDALISVLTGADDDTINVHEVYLRSIVDLQSGDGNDLFDLSADGSDSTGYLERLNDDPVNSPTVDAIAATRQLFLDGGSHSSDSRLFHEGAQFNGGSLTVTQLTEPAIEIGDIVRVDASSATTGLDLRYHITGPASGVLVSTVPSNPRATIGNEVFETLGIENIEVTTGTADDLMTVSSDIPFDIAMSLQRVAMNGSGGIDKFEVLGTTGDDQITIGDLGMIIDTEASPLEVSQVEFLRYSGGDGDDQLVNRTSVTSVIDGLDGSDIMIGGAGQDLLTGGAGVDYLFAADGDDVLFSDQELGQNVPVITDDEVLNGGSASSGGDVCVQHGADDIADCEVVGDGGGRKDVLTWLRAIFVDPDDIQFSDNFNFLNERLKPFFPAFPEPVAAIAVTEPSRLPFASLGSGDEDTTVEVPADFMDTNNDGTVSPSDALFVINQLAMMQVANGESTQGNLAADVNQDGVVDVRDALKVINYLALTRANKGSAEGEAVADTQSASHSWLQSLDSVFTKDDEWLPTPGELF
ncbi:dockerin type I domain-containing protein [Rhodopirellula sp. MGV]|uniref:dockerin type I domain-containing protein n=1 Tax=Rhodopirellula sp. MGV TaxID=2023130 RepID=UPI000B966370|nr:dockerin type I domain-containing protein [Rhodopirellula sp. MGV]OYP31134.1 hypothetical protein CGZ80_21320 [Rhodopirellula sp. MGV]PNY36043.1 hypothetical protein C2E31_15105 [Rhodopirellula baltica]